MGSSRPPSRRRKSSNVLLQESWNKQDPRSLYSEEDADLSASWCSSWTTLLVVMVMAVICIPYLLLGPRVVISVDISRMERLDTSAKDTGMPGASSRRGVLSSLHGGDDAARHHQQHPVLSGDGVLPSANQRQSPDYSMAQQPEGVVANLVSRRGDMGRTREKDNGSRPATRDLCLGTAVSDTDVQLVTFVASFREVAPWADLILFVDARSNDARREGIIEKYGIEVLRFNPEELLPEMLRRYHTSSYRWIQIQNFLDTRGFNYDRVMMVDIGDTLFQEDPFDIIRAPGLYAFAADHPIGWYPEIIGGINDCLGSSVVSGVIELPNLYSGVTMGTTSSAAAYARFMSTKLISPEFQSCEREGVDQGLHNYLLHAGNLGTVQMFDQKSGPLVDMKSGKYKLAKFRVVNLEDRVVPIVRCLAESGKTSLWNFFAKRFVYWPEQDEAEQLAANPNENQANPALRGAENVQPSSTAASVAATAATAVVASAAGQGLSVSSCTKYSVRDGVDLFRAKCDLSTVSAHDLEACCKACEERRRCKAFSFNVATGLCYTKTCNDPAAVGSTLRSVISGFKPSST